MITGELKSQVDKIWEAFWTGGISNPLSVIEQFTYLLFIRRLDERQLLEEKKANTVGIPIQNIIFTPEQKELRWSSFKVFISDMTGKVLLQKEVGKQEPINIEKYPTGTYLINVTTEDKKTNSYKIIKQ